MTTDFASRPRTSLCAVAKCEKESGLYVDARLAGPLLTRIFLCPEHETAWRNNNPLILDSSRFGWYLTGSADGLTLVERLFAMDGAITEAAQNVRAVQRKVDSLMGKA